MENTRPDTLETVETPRRDWSWIIIVMTLLVAIISLAWYSMVTGKSLTLIEVVLTALILKWGTLIDYRYGNSKKQAGNVAIRQSDNVKGKGEQ